MSSVKVQYTLRVTKWDTQTLESVKSGVKNMAVAIRSQAVLNAPFLTGALRQSAASVKQTEYSYLVSFGGTLKPFDYSYIREKYNNKNPHRRYYLQRAGETVSAKYTQYFKSIT